MKKTLLLCTLVSLGSSLHAAPKIIKKITRPHDWFLEPIVGGGLTSTSDKDLEGLFNGEIQNARRTKRSVIPFGGFLSGLTWDNIPGAGKDGGLIRLSTGILYQQKTNHVEGTFDYNPVGAALRSLTVKVSAKTVQIPVEIIYNFLREESFMMFGGAGIDFSFKRDSKKRLYDDQDRFMGLSLKPKKFHVFGTARAGLSWTFREGHRFTLNYWLTAGKINYGKTPEISDAAAGIIPIAVGPLSQTDFENNIKVSSRTHYFYLGYIRDFSL